MRSTVLRATAGGGLAVALLAGCATDPDPSRSGTGTKSAAARSGAGEPVRTDLQPLTRRFPALGTPVTASWQGGTLGDSRAPGPSTYWIKAVVTVEPAVAKRLRTAADVESTAAPDMPTELRTALPAGEWVRSAGLNKSLSASSDLAAQAIVSKTSDVVVVDAVGGN